MAEKEFEEVIVDLEHPRRIANKKEIDKLEKEYQLFLNEFYSEEEED